MSATVLTLRLSLTRRGLEVAGTVWCVEPAQRCVFLLGGEAFGVSHILTEVEACLASSFSRFLKLSGSELMTAVESHRREAEQRIFARHPCGVLMPV